MFKLSPHFLHSPFFRLSLKLHKTHLLADEIEDVISLFLLTNIDLAGHSFKEFKQIFFPLIIEKNLSTGQ